jgi:hypothetical protein
MCTLTLLRDRQGAGRDGSAPRWRIVFNRDEQRSRPAARPPALHVCGEVRTLYPVDLQGGGTWIAVTEHGLVLALLNGAERAAAEGEVGTARVSRGTIIPAIAASGARRAAVAPIGGLDATRYRPFHLVVADDREIVEVTSDGRTLVTAAPSGDDWLMRTSSSLEAEAVRAWRTRLFAAVGATVSWVEQDAFHARPEPANPAYGVTMARPDACTVSITTVEVSSDVVRMTYRPAGAGEAPAADLRRAT